MWIFQVLHCLLIARFAPLIHKWAFKNGNLVTSTMTPDVLPSLPQINELAQPQLGTEIEHLLVVVVAISGVCP